MYTHSRLLCKNFKQFLCVADSSASVFKLSEGDCKIVHFFTGFEIPWFRIRNSSDLNNEYKLFLRGKRLIRTRIDFQLNYLKLLSFRFSCFTSFYCLLLLSPSFCSSVLLTFLAFICTYFPRLFYISSFTAPKTSNKSYGRLPMQTRT